MLFAIKCSSHKNVLICHRKVRVKHKFYKIKNDYELAQTDHLFCVWN